MLRSAVDSYRLFGQPMGFIFKGQVLRRFDYHLRCVVSQKVRRSLVAGYCAPETNIAFVYKWGLIQYTVLIAYCLRKNEFASGISSLVKRF